MDKRPFGLTTIELILTVGIIGVIFAITIPVMRTLILKNDLDVSFNVLNQDIYRAQSLARNGERDSSWGVFVQSGSITVFRGNNYVSRDQDFDEIFTIPNAIQVTGTGEYVFSRFSGLTNPGSTTLQYAGESRTSTVNSKGMIEQQ